MQEIEIIKIKVLKGTKCFDKGIKRFKLVFWCDILMKFWNSISNDNEIYNVIQVTRIRKINDIKKD